MTKGTIVSLAGFLLLVGVVVALFLDGSLIGIGSPALVVQGLAVILMLWARLVFGRRSFHATALPTEGGLVTTGPYRFLRHPIYAAVLYFLLAGVLTHLSVKTIVLGLVAIGAVALRTSAEEHLLKRRYPEYAGYAARTKRVIPFLL